MELVKATFPEIVNSVGSKREFWTGYLLMMAMVSDIH